MHRNFFDEHSRSSGYDGTLALKIALGFAESAEVFQEDRDKVRFIPSERLAGILGNLPISSSTISDLLAAESQCIFIATQQLNGVDRLLFFQSMSLWCHTMCKLGAYAQAYDVVVVLHSYGLALRDCTSDSNVEGILYA